MSQTAIEIRHLSKVYQLGRYRPYKNLKAFIKKIFFRSQIKAEANTLAALNDINLTVKKGEIVGIIGRNGAGKSTLLKILSRITHPTEGEIDIYGRMTALLEVGSGFHPDLTGRENIYLNGTILGMTTAEIDQKFPEIVQFAELEDFIDTPVKHYSSGMYMRLAFAVSANLNHDILVLDEVLAVGDSSFQQKCLKRMEDETASGRTIIFVSHDLGSILAFCTRCLLMENGRIAIDGHPRDVIPLYQEKCSLNFNQNSHGVDVSGSTLQAVGDKEAGNFHVITDHWGIPHEIRESLGQGRRFGNGKAKINSFKMDAITRDGKVSAIMRSGYGLNLTMSFSAIFDLDNASATITIFDKTGNVITDIATAKQNEFISAKAGDEVKVHFTIKELLLRPDSYRIALWVGQYSKYDADCLPFAARLNVEINPETTNYSHTSFTGVYLCEFSQSINLSSRRERIGLADADH